MSDSIHGAELATNALRILPLGDSITAGYFVGNGGYRDLLRTELIGNGLQVTFVGRSTDQSDGIPDPAHEGYAGYTIRMIAAKAAEALDTFKPDVILLFAGTNDVRVNGSNDQPTHPDYWQTAASRLDDLMAFIRSHVPDAAVFVGTLMPFAGKWATREEAAQAFNVQLAGAVARRRKNGENVHLVDFRATITPEDLADGLHPNATGYAKMARAWREAIMESNINQNHRRARARSAGETAK